MFDMKKGPENFWEGVYRNRQCEERTKGEEADNIIVPFFLPLILPPRQFYHVPLWT